MPPDRVAELRATLHEELSPRSAIEEILVAELARHAAMLELCERAEMAVLRRAATELGGFHADVSSLDDQTDAALSAAVASDAIDSFARYRRGHEKGLISSLKALNEAAARRTAMWAIAPIAQRRIWEEHECETWLRERAAQGGWRCPHCGPATANWLASRKVLQCKHCRRHAGLRNGTVMAGSPLAWWVPRNPAADWGEGFWINHLMVPWINYDEVLDRQRTYDPVRFKNEVMGLPTTLGEHVVTRAELEACCRPVPMAVSLADVRYEAHPHLIAGIDWGGGMHSRTALAIGYMRNDFVFQVCRIESFSARQDPDRILREVAARCVHFQVRFIGADGGGNGHVYNRLLWDKLGGNAALYAIFYSAADQQPVQDGALWKWTVNRSATIGTVFARVKKQALLFPRRDDCGSFLDEFACVAAEHDDHLRAIRYTHPETQPDDALHACNYAHILAVRQFHGRSQYAF